MVTKLFVDTWGWLTLHDRREDQHATVVKQYQTIRAAGGQVYTTDYVLDETFTLFSNVYGLSRQKHRWSYCWMLLSKTAFI